ncbi:hypothetical protein BDV95DRAFT_602863 [Massariosphaeria phaeospora]|uniref:Uncharacterized protein n=1 Tax=Massariosphaeria phaeospora TaxID=100035 RepID=A0A7C8IBL4_9PLEO|nr:hypothetical protein BDV95DRAFT_602863 [Massariosphaeria phaeospora]
MARRSARLKKRSPTPSDDSMSSWETAPSKNASPAERLAATSEEQEPAMRTPQKPVRGDAQKPEAVSHLPQAMARTPKNRTPIRPAGEEMHPARHHASTAKPLEEARWLGFQALGAHTAPSKANGAAFGQNTPSKTPVLTSTSSKVDIFPAPEFKFSFKSPFSGLSPKASHILKGRSDEGTVVGRRALFGADEFSTPADISQQRKMAVPKAKMSRFSDVHMAQFKKMDSIANHPSAFRADLTRTKPTSNSLKRSPSKAGLEKEESTSKAANGVKRTPSKLDISEAANKVPSTGLKRTQSKMDLTEPTKIPATPLKRTQSKMDLGQPSSNLPRTQSTVKLVPPTRDGRLHTQDGNPGAKRVKRTTADDAATTRPTSRDGRTDPPQQMPATPAARKITSQTALPRLAARLMTPTKSSIARSQSVKTLKSTSMAPSLLRSPSARTLFSPTSIGQAMKEGVREGMRKTSNSLNQVRSILRTPHRKYSADPKKIAAGTHMSPPPGLDLARELPKVPVTAPVKKQVNFTNSTLERAAHDELGKSPSPMKLRAGSEVPTGAVIYPSLQSGIEYPSLTNDDKSSSESTSRRLTFGDATTTNTSGEFSFTFGNPVKFGPPPTGTIRVVRKSDASSLVDGKKRKLETVEGSSDKENNGPAADEGRASKKMKPTPSEPSKTPSSVSKLPRRTPHRGSSISKSRLAWLATPKRNKP